MIDFLIALALAGFAGMLASTIFRGLSFGILGYIVIGFIGGIIGEAIYKIFPVSIGGGYFRDFLLYFFGALLILFFINLFRRKKGRD